MSYVVLIAEDDADIRALLKLYLENSGYRTIQADNGDDALSVVRNEHVDLALLDIMLPGLDGFRLTREIRKFTNIPVVILSAKDQDCDKILGLNIGADDYLTKPFNPLEVVAHVQSCLRRYYQLGSGKDKEIREKKLRIGKLCLDVYQMKLEKDGVPIDLTAKEFRILSQMMKEPGRVFTKSQLYGQSGGYFGESDDKTMMVHISKLREKIEDNPKEPKYIKTIRGLGYKIEYRE